MDKGREELIHCFQISVFSLPKIKWKILTQPTFCGGLSSDILARWAYLPRLLWAMPTNKKRPSAQVTSWVGVSEPYPLLGAPPPPATWYSFCDLCSKARSSQTPELHLEIWAFAWVRDSFIGCPYLPLLRYFQIYSGPRLARSDPGLASPPPVHTSWKIGD